jgi:hypothetical protein
MPDELGPAVAVLQRKLDEQMQAVAETKKIINMLLKSMGKPPQYADVAEGSGIIRADQFYGKPFATAAQKYLELRRQACQPDEILRGLMEGGFDFDIMPWEKSDRLRSLSLSLAKNNLKFHRLKNGSFGLREWYDPEFLTKERQNDATPKERKAKKKKKRGHHKKTAEAKGLKLLPDTKGRPAVDQTSQNENGIESVKKKRGRPPTIHPDVDQISKAETA